MSAITIDTVAAELGCSRQQATSRLTALGYVETCGRCGGSGRYSYNQMDGDRCYGCNGKKRCLVRLTAKVAREAKARIEAGELADYFARCKAIAEARKAVAPIAAWIETTWRDSAVSRSYTAASRASYHDNDAPKTVWTITEAGRDATGIFRDVVLGFSPLYFAQSLSNDIWSASVDIVDAVRDGRLNAVRGLAQITELRDMLVTLYSVANPEQIAAWGFKVPALPAEKAA